MMNLHSITILMNGKWIFLKPGFQLLVLNVGTIFLISCVMLCCVSVSDGIFCCAQEDDI